MKPKCISSTGTHTSTAQSRHKRRHPELCEARCHCARGSEPLARGPSRGFGSGELPSRAGAQRQTRAGWLWNPLICIVPFHPRHFPQSQSLRLCQTGPEERPGLAMVAPSLCLGHGHTSALPQPIFRFSRS